MKSVVFARALICGMCGMVAMPSEARFLQVDPVGYENRSISMSMWQTTPVNLVDSTGERVVIAGPKTSQVKAYNDLKAVVRSSNESRALVRELKIRPSPRCYQHHILQVNNCLKYPFDAGPNPTVFAQHLYGRR